MVKLSSIILEGKYDSFVTTISHEIINHIKRGKKRFDFYESLPMYLNIGDEDLGLKFKVEIKYNKNLDLKDVMITSFGDEYEIELDIYINKEATYKDFLNSMIGELKETIMHELEHVLQLYKIGNRPRIGTQDVSTDYKYLTAKYEVQAYVAGLYKRAKSEKKPFYVLVDDMLNQYIKSGSINQKQAEKIKKIWFDFAKKRYPKAKLGE